ncbi:hypothetical protein F4680DRAFT_203521 [Xylaria scruposa]|nr:hypothetical protein F4680DRAFT_203521 [Xylaria scruposa]
MCIKALAGLKRGCLQAAKTSGLCMANKSASRHNSYHFLLTETRRLQTKMVTSYLEARYVDRAKLDALLQRIFGQSYNVEVSGDTISVEGHRALTEVRISLVADLQTKTIITKRVEPG